MTITSIFKLMSLLLCNAGFNLLWIFSFIILAYELRVSLHVPISVNWLISFITYWIQDHIQQVYKVHVLGILMNDSDVLWRVAKYVTFQFCLWGNLCLDKNKKVECTFINIIYCCMIYETTVNLIEWINKKFS